MPSLPLVGDCSTRTLKSLSGEEDVEGDFEHVLGLGSALGSSVEAREIVSEGGVRGLDEVGLRLRLLVRFTRPDALEGETVAGVGIGEDGADLTDGRLGQPVDGDGAVHARVTDMIGDDPPVLAAVGRPDYRAAGFFWT